MDEVILRKTFTMRGEDLKRAFREEAEFKADRSDAHGTLRYMAHANGYVMVRRPGRLPFVLPEKEWRGMTVDTE
jgi:hypothetical protein